MEIKDYYLHSISDYKCYPSRNALIKLENILSSNYLLSKRMQNLEPKYVGFNGLDYISLCDPLQSTSYYSAYSFYVENSLSLMFTKNIDVIIPEIVYGGMLSPIEVTMLGNSKNIRYSNLLDEVQVKDQVSLNNLVGLTIPLNNIFKNLYTKNMNKQNLIRELNKIKDLLIKYNHNVPIYDINNMIEISNEKNIDKVLKKTYM